MASLRDYITLVESAGDTLDAGTIVAASKGDGFDKVVHYLVRTFEGPWRRIEFDHVSFKALMKDKDEVPSLDGYTSGSVLQPPARSGAFIQHPVQIIGFPEGHAFVTKSNKVFVREGDGINENGRHFELFHVAPNFAKPE